MPQDIPIPISETPGIDVGYLVGRFIEVGPTTVAVDSDRKPETTVTDFSVTLSSTATNKLRYIPGAVLYMQDLTLTFDSDGYFIDSSGQPGLWLPVGEYQVKIYNSNKEVIPGGYLVTLTTDHTVESPLDISAAMPYDAVSEGAVLTAGNVTDLLALLASGGIINGGGSTGPDAGTLTARDAALAAKQAAQDYATAALASQGAAHQSELTAGSSASTATVAAGTATDQATIATTARQDSQNARDLAKQYRDEAEAAAASGTGSGGSGGSTTTGPDQATLDARTAAVQARDLAQTYEAGALTAQGFAQTAAGTASTDAGTASAAVASVTQLKQETLQFKLDAENAQGLSQINAGHAADSATAAHQSEENAAASALAAAAGGPPVFTGTEQSEMNPQLSYSVDPDGRTVTFTGAVSEDMPNFHHFPGDIVSYFDAGDGFSFQPPHSTVVSGTREFWDGTFSLVHVYNRNGTFNPSMQCTYTWGPMTQDGGSVGATPLVINSDANVPDIAPGLSVYVQGGLSIYLSTYAYNTGGSGNAYDPNLGVPHIDFGDGTSADWADNSPDGQDNGVSGPYAYAASGQYTITATWTYIAGPKSGQTASATFIVNV